MLSQLLSLFAVHATDRGKGCVGVQVVAHGLDWQDVRVEVIPPVP